MSALDPSSCSESDPTLKMSQFSVFAQDSSCLTNKCSDWEDSCTKSSSLLSSYCAYFSDIGSWATLIVSDLAILIFEGIRVNILNSSIVWSVMWPLVLKLSWLARRRMKEKIFSSISPLYSPKSPPSSWNYSPELFDPVHETNPSTSRTSA